MAREDILASLRAGEAFVDLTSWRKVAVAGADAPAWLNDLLSADLSGLGPGSTATALLLSPTGGVRAAAAVANLGDGELLLLQDPVQPSPIDRLLAPYTLSSAVRMEDRTGHLALLSFPGAARAPGGLPDHVATVRPSALGGGGVDLVSAIDRRPELVRELAAVGLIEASLEDVEDWRIDAGIPRVGVDVGPEDLPQEGGLEAAVSFGKGCYLGQEAMARVRNLGHPRRVLLPLAAGGPVAAGDAVHVDGREAGRVTSVGGHGDADRTAGRTGAAAGRAVLAKVRWQDREGPFVTARGTPLTPRRLA